MSAIIAKTIEKTIEKHRASLGQNAAAFLERVYGGGFEKYSTRLSQHGFRGFCRVLDAGCGFGQWTLALSWMNQSVEAVDISEKGGGFHFDTS